jgi:hypothetical protein
MQKRRKIRVKGGMDLRAYFVATKDRPKSRAMMVKARKGRMPTSPRDDPPTHNLLHQRRSGIAKERIFTPKDRS